MSWLIQRGPIWYIGYRQGERDRYQSTKTANRDEAIKKQKELDYLQSLGQPESKPDGSMLLDVVIQMYKDQADLKANTIRANNYSWAKFKQLTNVFTIDDMQKADLIKRFKAAAKTAKLSPAYESWILRDVRKLMRFAVEKKICTTNLFHAVALPQQEKVARVLTPQEEERFLNACQPLLKRLVLVELATGLRLSQLCAMQWKQFDKHQQVLYVPGQKRQKERFIPLFDGTIQLFGNIKDEGRIFPEFEGYSDEEAGWFVEGMFRRAKTKAGIKGRLRFHDLRHTCASRLAQKLTPYELRDFFGWSSVALTDRYTHTRVEDIRKKLQQ